jgi:hypothetical protein
MPSMIRKVRSILVRQLEKRFFSKAPPRHIQMALALNPSLIPTWDKIFGVDLAGRMRSTLSAECRRRGDTQGVVPEAPRVTSAARDATGEKRQRVSLSERARASFQTVNVQPLEEVGEVASYMALSDVDLAAGMVDMGEGKTSFDTLKFWGPQKKRRPRLYKAARAAYSAQPTEANTERTFTAAGLVYADCRTCLSVELASAFMMVERNASTAMPSVTDIKARYYAIRKEKHGVDQFSRRDERGDAPV